MKKHLLFILFIISGFLSFGQNFQWAKSFGGQSYSGGGLIKLDSYGNIYTLGGYSGYADFELMSGKITLSGGENFVSKSNASGELLWVKSFPRLLNSMQLDSKGNIYITGDFEGKLDFDPDTSKFILNSDGGNDVFILKLDNSGNLKMAKRIGGKNNDHGKLIELDKSGNIYVTGTFDGLVDFDPGTPTYKISGYGNFRLKLDISGNFISVKTSQVTLDPKTVDNKGNIYTTGSFSGKKDFDPDPSKTFYLTSVGDHDVFVLKVDSNGKFIWAKSMGGRITDKGNSIAVDKFHNVYITGFFEDSIDLDPGSSYHYQGSAGKTDIFISKLDSLGNLIWAKGIGGIDTDVGSFITLDDSSNLYITGGFEDTVDFDPGSGIFKIVAGYNEFFILKLDKSGKYIWAKKLEGTGWKRLNSIFIDKEQNLFATGVFYGTIDFNPDLARYNLDATAGYQNGFILKLGRCPSPAEKISGPISLCGGVNKASYFITPASGANGYKWIVPKGATIDSGQNSNKIYVTFGGSLGEISVIPNNICDTTKYSKLTIVRSPLPKVVAKASHTIACKGYGAYLYGTGASTYTWSKGKIDGVSFIADSTDTYVVTGTDKNGCIAKDSITLIVSGVASPSSINGPVTLCGNEKATYSVTPIAGAKGYTWTVPYNAIIDSGQNTATIYVTFGTSPGQVTVIPTNACNSNKTTLYVSVTNSSIGINASPSASICKGTAVTLSATGGSNYNWSGGITNGISFIPDTSTTYSVSETGSTGCAGKNSIFIKVNPLPKVGAYAHYSPIVCKGKGDYLYGTGAYTYTWTGGISNGVFFKPDSTTTYIVTGTDLNGCKDTASFTMTMIEPPVISLQPFDQTATVGSMVKFVVSTPSPTATFKWYRGDGGIFLTNGSIYSGVNDDTLIIKNVTFSENLHSYSCFVYEGKCFTLSGYALIRVESNSIVKPYYSRIFSIFPNPATNQITIESDHTLNNEPYYITDQTGRQILKGELNNKTNRIDISALAKGFYFLQVGESNKQVFKIVKQ